MHTIDTRHYRVQGMTCQHCVASVTDDVTGSDVSDEAVRGAVEDAGSTLVR